MNVPAKLAGFAALSAVVFIAALGVGATVGPIDTPAINPHAPATGTHHDNGTGQ